MISIKLSYVYRSFCSILRLLPLLLIFLLCNNYSLDKLSDMYLDVLENSHILFALDIPTHTFYRASLHASLVLQIHLCTSVRTSNSLTKIGIQISLKITTCTNGLILFVIIFPITTLLYRYTVGNQVVGYLVCVWKSIIIIAVNNRIIQQLHQLFLNTHQSTPSSRYTLPQ